MTTKSTEIREMIEVARAYNTNRGRGQTLVLKTLDALNGRMDEIEAGQKRMEEAWRLAGETANGIQPD